MERREGEARAAQTRSRQQLTARYPAWREYAVDQAKATFYMGQALDAIGGTNESLGLYTAAT